MKNKILSVLAISFVLCACLFALASCGDDEPMHTHNFSTLKVDKDGHWYECVCGVKDSFEQHTPEDSGWCSVCEQVVLSTNGIYYEVSADGTYAEVITYLGTSTKVNIASTYNGVPVTSIYSSAFKNIVEFSRHINSKKRYIQK